MKPSRAESGLVLLLAFLAGSAALFRMADSLSPFDADQSVAHHYEYLTEGFLAGHTSLSVAPAADLVALGDPYRPGQRISTRLLDASLYQGKYYIYYGPGPAVLLMLPWRVLAGHEMPQRLAVASFGSLGLAALALLVASVRRRHFPSASGLAAAGAFLCALFASWLPVVARRPLFWELPIVAAVACLWWALYFLWRYHDSGGRIAWAAAAGAALAFAIASRATDVFAAGALLVILLVPVIRSGPGARRWSPFVLASSVVTAAGLLLLVYNHARFGRWLEFGQSYQLWGDEYRNMRFLSPQYILFNLRQYLVGIARPSPYFPFVRPALPVDGPTGYMGIDEVYGVAFAAPIQAAGLAAVAWVLPRRNEAGSRSLAVTVAAGAASSVLAGLVLLSWGGACSRYVAELWAGWTPVAAFGVLAVFSDWGKGRTALRALVGAAGLWTAGFVLLASADYNGIARKTQPAVYDACARLLDYPSLWWIKLRGIGFGPVEVRVHVAPGAGYAETPLLESGRRDRLNQLVLAHGKDGTTRLQFNRDGSDMGLGVPLAVREGDVTARVTAPWLYPPAAHPWWDGVADPGRRRALQSEYSIEVGGAGPLAYSRSEDAEEYFPGVLSQGDPGADLGWIASIRRIAPP